MEDSKDLIKRSFSCSQENDTISRQAAIDAVSRGCQEWRGIFAECKKNLNELPPAQPEIVQCKDCKYWDSIGYCVYGSRLAWRGNYNDYCSCAKRREG